MIDADTATSTIFFEFRHVMRLDNDYMRQDNTAGHYSTRHVRTTAGWRIQSRIEQAIFETIGNSCAMQPHRRVQIRHDTVCPATAIPKPAMIQGET